MADVTRILLALWSSTATLATAPFQVIGTNASRILLSSRLGSEAFGALYLRREAAGMGGLVE